MTTAATAEASVRPRGRAELCRALGALAEPPEAAQQRLADLLDLPRPAGTDWTEAFVVQLVPHASIYLGPDGMLGGEAADRIAGFWRALRLPVPAEPDHVTALLGLYATLVDAEHDEPDPPRRALRRQARAALLHEHLLSWLPAYTYAMTGSGPPPYACWARLLSQTLLAEAADVGVPQSLPIHLRSVPAVTADGGLDDLLAGLLAPARSGVILTRAHLAMTARHTGLGLRRGNRRAILRALIEQDPAATLAAFTRHTRDWVRRHRTDEPTVGPSARHWADSASATTDLLTTARLAAARLTRPDEPSPGSETEQQP